MEGGSLRRWDELIPDALALIFSHLSLQEVLTVIPMVCKSWNRAVMGPYCWQEIDIEEWSNNRSRELVDRMLRMLINRGSGSLRKLCVSSVNSDDTFSFIAENARSLQTLKMPRSEISNSIVEQCAGRLSTITFLDVSYCSKIGGPALEAIGKNCNSLEVLCRNMHPLHVVGKPSQNDESHAIATTMPKLKRLELGYHLISTNGVMEILSSCPSLEFLDLRGCWDVELDDKTLKERLKDLKVLGPDVDDYYEQNDWNWGWGDCSDYSDASDYLAWDLMDGDMGDFYDDIYGGVWDENAGLEQLELRFYDEFDGDAGLYGWPPSP